MVALALLLLAATPTPVRLVVPSFTLTGVAPEAAQGAFDDLLQQLTRRGLEVHPAADAAVVPGSDGVLLGELHAADDARVMRLRINSPDGRTLATASMTTTERGLHDAIAVLSRELVTQLRPKFEAGRIPEEQGRLKRSHALGPALAAGLLGSLGGVFLNLHFTNAPAYEAFGWAAMGLASASLVAAILILILGDPP